VRLSPKYIFLGIVVLGLPFAIMVGWALGASLSESARIAVPAGAGGMGPAPQRDAPSAPVTPLDQPAPNSPPRIASSTAPVAVTSSAVPPEARATSLPPRPALTDPPAPTPALPSSAPVLPSATPSTSDVPDVEGSVAERLVRRP
jgi:hypothetical protein